jgi:Fe-S-cluster-containing dehydrogenase component
MKTKRRSFLKGLLGVGAGAAVVPMVANTATASGNKEPDDNHMGMFYDATLCIGCKACEVACKKANDLKPEYGSFNIGGLNNLDSAIWDAPGDLSVNTLNIIKLYKDGDNHSFVKRQCMHCVDANCVSGCPTNALIKQDNGAVTWDIDACVGCRYCQMNCPFNIPKFEFNHYYGKIVKCQLCADIGLLDKNRTACTDVCPSKAVIFGKLKDLKAEAQRRLAADPDRYNGQVYGDTEGGGLGVIYLSKVPFEKLGLPKLKNFSYAAISEGVQHTLYKGMIAPIVAYAVIVFAAFKTLSKNKENQ